MFASFLLAFGLGACYNFCMTIYCGPVKFLEPSIAEEFGRLLKGGSMAERPLVDVPVTATVSASEVERFKIEKVAEKAFLIQLAPLVTELGSKVSPRSRVYAAMVRFMKNQM